jgi:hypothetical protein
LWRPDRIKTKEEYRTESQAKNQGPISKILNPKKGLAE